MQIRHSGLLSVFFLSFLALILWTLSPPAFSTEYFAGPFPSWLNVQTGYGATGNGSTDDTAALQNAINAVSALHSVVYLPAGNYKISAPLTVQNQIGFSFIGASPAATTIVWAGPVSVPMMLVEATTNANWGRITWEGSGIASMGVAHTCLSTGCTGGGGYAPTDLLHFDEVFQDMGKGIVGGLNGANNNSEVTITRCTFRNCSYAGLSVESYNALDYWVWDSQFYNNTIGMTNNVSGGNFTAYRCLFENSTTADITFSNTEFFSFRDNVSIGSKQFLQGLGYASAAEVNLQGNRIVTSGSTYAVGMLDMGPLILVDNQIECPSGYTGPSVELATPNGTNVGGPDLISIGNQYTESNAVTVVSNQLAPGQSPQWWEMEDQVVPYGSISSALPTMPPLPTQLNTNITDMPVGSSAASIQAAINAATGTNPVIHLSAGSYTINQTITVPANLNIFIVGDNYKTQLVRSGTSGPMFELLGPSKATIRDISFNGGTADGILVLNADQAGARVYGDGLYMTTDRTGDVLADTLANTHVDLQGFEPSRAGLVSVKSIGAGSPSASRVGIYGGGAGTNAGVDPTNGWMYEVSNGGSMLIEDAWYESTDSPTAVNLTSSDSGDFCFWSGNIGQGSNGVNAPAGPPVNINGFNGMASFLNINYGLQTGSNITVNPSSQTQALFLGQVANMGQVPAGAINYLTDSGTSGEVYLENSQAQTYASSTQNNNVDVPDIPANTLPALTPPAFPVSFIDNMLSLACSAGNQEVPLTTDLPSGVTDVRLYRLAFDNCGMGLHITSSSTVPTPVPTSTFTAVISFTTTVSPTKTPTRTPTSSFTNTPTSTPTLTSTHSITTTPTFTASWTPTASYTVTKTHTSTPSGTPTRTFTSSSTATSTRSMTSTATPSITPTTTSSSTLTPTRTATPSPANSLTSTSTPTSIGTFSSTVSTTPTPTPANSATTSATMTESLTPIGTGTYTVSVTPTLTASPTSTPVNSSTPSATETPSVDILISAPYPNPSNGETFHLNIQVPSTSTVRLSVFTLGFRKIFETSSQISSGGTISWDTRDIWGTPVSNGLYYFQVQILGITSKTKVLKVMLVR